MTRANQISERAYLTNGRAIGGSAIPDSELPQTQHRWPLKTGSGTTWADTVGSEDATASFENWVQGNFIGDYKVELDGTDDKADTGAVMPAGSMWLSATVDIDSIPSSRQYIQSARDDGSAGGRILQFNNNDNYRFGVYNDSGNFFGVETPISTGLERLVGYLDTSESEIAIAVNGTVQTTASVSGSFSTQLSSGFHGLGYDRTTSSEYMAEGLDDCGIGAASPSSSEIQNDYDSMPWS